MSDLDVIAKILANNDVLFGTGRGDEGELRDKVINAVLAEVTGGACPPSGGPEHYSLDPEPIEVIGKWDLDFCLGNAVKYIARAGHKDGESRDKDLKKAMDYLHREIYGRWPWEDEE